MYTSECFGLGGRKAPAVPKGWRGLRDDEFPIFTLGKDTRGQIVPKIGQIVPKITL